MTLSWQPFFAGLVGWLAAGWLPDWGSLFFWFGWMIGWLPVFFLAAILFAGLAGWLAAGWLHDWGNVVFSSFCSGLVG